MRAWAGIGERLSAAHNRSQSLAEQVCRSGSSDGSLRLRLTILSSKAAAARRRFNTTSKTVAKWVDRFNAQGLEGLRDRSSRPHSLPSQIPLATADAVERLRRERRTREHIADELRISKASVSRIINLAHGALYLLGCYIGFTIASRTCLDFSSAKAVLSCSGAADRGV